MGSVATSLWLCPGAAPTQLLSSLRAPALGGQQGGGTRPLCSQPCGDSFTGPPASRWQVVLPGNLRWGEEGKLSRRHQERSWPGGGPPSPHPQNSAAPQQRERAPGMGPCKHLVPQGAEGFCCPLRGLELLELLGELLGSRRTSLCWMTPCLVVSPCHQAGAPDVPRSLLPKERVELLHLQTCSGCWAARPWWCQSLLCPPWAQKAGSPHAGCTWSTEEAAPRSWR